MSHPDWEEGDRRKPILMEYTPWGWYAVLLIGEYTRTASGYCRTSREAVKRLFEAYHSQLATHPIEFSYG